MPGARGLELKTQANGFDFRDRACSLNDHKNDSNNKKWTQCNVYLLPLELALSNIQRPALELEPKQTHAPQNTNPKHFSCPSRSMQYHAMLYGLTQYWKNLYMYCLMLAYITQSFVYAPSLHSEPSGQDGLHRKRSAECRRGRSCCQLHQAPANVHVLGKSGVPGCRLCI